MELYEKLYELRRASGMSQEELAEKLGVSPDEVLTPELAARLLRLEALHTRVFLNQADTPEKEALGRRMAAELPCPVCIGALQKGSLQLC